MPKAAPRSASSPSFLLVGEEALAYLSTLRRLLAVSRAGAQYSDWHRIDAFLAHLGPQGSRGLRAGVDVDRTSGLPAMHELVRVRAEREVAIEQGRGPRRRPSPKAEYLRSLASVELAAISDAEVRLVERAGRRSRFQIVRDLFDVHQGCFVRFTFRVAQQGPAHIGLQRQDLAHASPAFRRAIERCSATDAEVALLLLCELPGLVVEEVVRGQIGPLSPPAATGLAPLAQVLLAHPGAAALHLALERAGPGVAEDRCLDPLARLYREGLAGPARALAEARRGALGYRVCKERRLCCSAPVEAPLREALIAAGSPLVVRSR